MSVRPGDREPGPVLGIVLAAGAGARMGRPKALIVGTDGEPWLRRAIRTLEDGGCTEVIVVLGAAADEARAHLPASAAAPSVNVVAIDDWATGLSASLRAGLATARAREAEAAVITLVDLPRLAVAAVERMLAPHPFDPHPLSTALRQASYDGRPGHPVLVGRDHFDALAAGLHGDTGARGYLKAHSVDMVDCTDLGGGDDVDTPEPHLDIV